MGLQKAIRGLANVAVMLQQRTIVATTVEEFDSCRHQRPPTEFSWDTPSSIPVLSYAIHPRCVFNQVWAVLVMLLVIFYVGLILPITLTFQRTLNLDSWMGFSDYGLGVIFLLDFLLKFRLAYVLDWRGDTVPDRDGRNIARRYVLSLGFVVDLLCTIPSVATILVMAIDKGEDAPLLVSLKLLWFLRICEFWVELLFDEEFSFKYGVVAGQYIRSIIHILYIFAALVNFGACLLLYVAFYWEDTDLSWLANVNSADLTGAPGLAQYLAAVYFSVITVTTTGYGDVSANSECEQVACIIVAFFGTLLFGYITATLSVVINSETVARRKKQELVHKLENVSQWTKLCSASESTKAEVKRCIKEDLAYKHHASDYYLTCCLFPDLPVRLQEQLAQELLCPLVHHLLPGLDKLVAFKLSSRLKPMLVRRGTYIYEGGDPLGNVYFIASGSVELIDDGGRVSKRVSGPCIAGILELYSAFATVKHTKKLHKAVYTLSCLAFDELQIWSLDIRKLSRLLEIFPSLSDVFRRAAEKMLRVEPGLWVAVMAEQPGSTAAAVPRKLGKQDQVEMKRSYSSWGESLQ